MNNWMLFEREKDGHLYFFNGEKVISVMPSWQQSVLVTDDNLEKLSRITANPNRTIKIEINGQQYRVLKRGTFTKKKGG